MSNTQAGAANVQEPKSAGALGLHCLRQPSGEVAVVFLHGVLSSGETAWGQPSWPCLLATDPELPPAGVYVFSYRTNSTSGDYGMGDAAENLGTYFDLEDIRKCRKLVLVGHSMGGIVARRFVLSRQAEFIRDGAEIGFFLIASPSLGSNAANRVALLAWLSGHTQALDLRASPTNTWLNNLDRDFINLRDGGYLKITGRELVEDKPTSIKRMLGLLGTRVVDTFSAARYFAKSVKVPDSDHISIAKPRSRDTLQYRVLKRFLLDFAQQNGETWLAPIDEQETHRARDAVTGLANKISEIAQWHDAFAALQEALIETRSFVASQKTAANRDPKAEMRLSRIWSDVGRALSPHAPALAALCYVKGQGWADPKLWSDPTFSKLPIELDDMSKHLIDAMLDPAQLKQGLAAINNNLNRLEDIRQHEAGGSTHITAVTNQLSTDGSAVEFKGLGESRTVTLDQFAELHHEDREAIAASETAMQKLSSDWRELIKRGRLSELEKQERHDIEAQIAEHLDLILSVVETALGGQLQDHYESQRQIVRQFKQRQSARSQ